MDNNLIIDQIFSEIKRKKISNLELDDQRDAVENIVLNVTGLSSSDNKFEEFVNKILEKSGLYDGEYNDSGMLAAYNIAKYLKLVKPYVGWSYNANISAEKIFDTYCDLIDEEYFINDYLAISLYFEEHNINIIGDLSDYTEYDD